ncbi:MAG TPA: SH3 domain-containing protein, partial [Thermomicrobiales bacterium]|nr:SH3 domain-containing protein [Thermomicrobiales bacterium]
MRYPRPTAAIWSWLARCTIIGVLMITMLAPSLTAAQEEFDLPPTVDDYTGLQAITANSVDGVNLRAEPNVESEILLSVPDGNIVDLRVDTVHTVTSGGIRWWPVSIWGVDGWVAGLYLASTDSTSPADAPTAESDASDSDASTGTWAAGDYVAANTDNLAMRAGPGTNESRIAWLGLGDVVQIVDGPFMNGNSDWWLISDGSINAYVFGRYLTTASELDIQAPAADTPSFAAGDAAEIALGSGGANIR